MTHELKVTWVRGEGYGVETLGRKETPRKLEGSLFEPNLEVHRPK